MIVPPFAMPSDFDNQKINFDHPMLARHNITVETALAFGASLHTGSGPLRGSILLPIHNPDASVGGYAAIRTTHARNSFTLLPNTLDRTQILFNLMRALQTRERTVVVVEDPIDCARVHQMGFQTVVALLGPKMSETQELYIIENFHAALLMLHGDDLGWAATQDSIRRLATQIWVHAAVLPSGSRPSDMPDADLLTMIRHALRVE